MNSIFNIVYCCCVVVVFSSCVRGQAMEDSLPELENASATDFFEERQSVFQAELTKAKQFLASNKFYNQEVVMLIDMKIPSGNHRFFIYNTQKDSILHKALVAHGSGSVTGEEELVFSNIPNSYQTSLGKYKIGKSYSGSFGKSYKLHGLESTNNKAYERAIVLHPYSCVPDEEQPYEICESLGCPMVSNEFMKTLYSVIDSSEKPMLMVIYY